MKHASTNSPETEARVRSFLQSHPIGVLSTVTPRGKPHATVVYVSTNDDLSLSFLTKHNTTKTKNIKRNNHVMFVAYEPSSQTTLQAEGRAINITDTPEAEEVFRKTLQSVQNTSKSNTPPISKLDAGRYVAYKIVPNSIRIAVFAHGDNAMEMLYETLTY